MYWIDAHRPVGDELRTRLQQRGWTQAELAEIIGCQKLKINRIVNGRTGITYRTAVQLAAAFDDTTPEYWWGLERDARLKMLAG